VGGVDYITKPFQDEEAPVRVQTHLKNHLLTQENRELEQEIAMRKMLGKRLMKNFPLSPNARQNAGALRDLSDVAGLSHAATMR